MAHLSFFRTPQQTVDCYIQTLLLWLTLKWYCVVTSSGRRGPIWLDPLWQVCQVRPTGPVRWPLQYHHAMPVALEEQKLVMWYFCLTDCSVSWSEDTLGHIPSSWRKRAKEQERQDKEKLKGRGWQQAKWKLEIQDWKKPASIASFVHYICSRFAWLSELY